MISRQLAELSFLRKTSTFIVSTLVTQRSLPRSIQHHLAFAITDLHLDSTKGKLSPINPHLMVPKSAKKGLQRQQPAPGIAQSLIESVADVHEGFEDMLNNFGKLHIESPEAAIEHPAWQNHSSGWELAKELCTTYQLDRDVLPWWELEVDEQVRCMGDSACQISNKELDMAALDTHFILEHNSKGRIPLTEISPDLEESLALVDEVLPITSSSEREAVSPAMSRLPGESEIDWPGGSLYFGDHLQNHESVLELRVPKRDLPNEQPTFAPGFVREMIMKPDGSKFVVTSIHHLTTYKPSKPSSLISSKRKFHSTALLLRAPSSTVFYQSVFRVCRHTEKVSKAPNGT
ncbi:hypothetical protein ONS95_006204 [Cadophora gregata]|uniref:uncharacterized protein n=1 Tax=Cadophora gregata TaxID=51156 RepID=UPI0026DAB79E|nr:uncharacterized protein ONS95_006204 [Cadophora gregata]KAK0102595.1 hypothetical protein ONS95_006204 [Cadophora gregata]